MTEIRIPQGTSATAVDDHDTDEEDALSFPQGAKIVDIVYTSNTGGRSMVLTPSLDFPQHQRVVGDIWRPNWAILGELYPLRSYNLSAL